MYTFTAVLIGICEKVLPHVRRELLNLDTRLEAEFLDVNRALMSLSATRDQSRLFIFYLKSARDLSQLKRLSGLFVGQPIVALVEEGKEPSTLVGAMRAGATQVVPLPLNAEDFRAALDCIAMQFGHSKSLARVITVCGANGGCGTTSVAINLAYEISQQYQEQTILAELSLQMGDLAGHLNAQPRFTIQDLLQKVQALDSYMVQRALTRFSDTLHLLAGPNRALTTTSASCTDVMRVLDLTRVLADVVVLDVPANYSDLYFETLATADQIVLVCEQKIPSIRNLRLVLDTLGRSAHRAHVVINRYDPTVKGFTLTELAQLLKLSNLCSVSRDSALDEAQAQGCPVRLVRPGSCLVAEIDQLAQSLLGISNEAVPPSVSTSFLGRLTQAIGLS